MVTKDDDWCSAADTPHQGSRDASPQSSSNDTPIAKTGGQSMNNSSTNQSSTEFLKWTFSKEEFKVVKQGAFDSRKLVPVLEGVLFVNLPENSRSSLNIFFQIFLI